MVRIVDGEIVQDDDPRLTARARGAPMPHAQSVEPGQATSASALAATGAVFDFSCPPVRVAADEGGNLGGLPSLVVFGASVLPQHLLMLLAAGALIGWRGVLVGCILWYVMKAQGGNQRRAQQHGDQDRRIAAAQDYFTSLFDQAPLGRGGARAAAAVRLPPTAPAASSRKPTDHWANKGTPHKLSD